MAAQKINEAHEHIAKAEKCLKTSLTKWKPDFDSAASEYSKAAVCFKNAKQYEQAKDAYLKEAEYHTENKTLFHAAKAIEQAGMMLKEQKKMPEAIQYIEKACMMYMENGTPDTAAMALDRAGKLIEPINLEKAVDLYQKAAGVFENEDRLRQAVELLGKASRLLVRLKRLDEAAVAVQKEKNMYKEIENYPMCFKKGARRKRDLDRCRVCLFAQQACLRSYTGGVSDRTMSIRHKRDESYAAADGKVWERYIKRCEETLTSRETRKKQIRKNAT
ncbi:unnamed protein product [Knipowitschia caucasica]